MEGDKYIYFFGDIHIFSNFSISGDIITIDNIYDNGSVLV